MIEALVHAFAPASQRLVAGAAPPAVLGRQLPRLAVQALNADGDRGLRFFPLIGQREGERRFVELDGLLPVEQLLALHGDQVAPRFVVDGCVEDASLRLRIVRVEGQRVVFNEQVPLDHAAPLPALSRLLFELMSVLGWQGAPPVPTRLQDGVLAWFLCARDHLLCVEAGVPVEDPSALLIAGERLVERAPDDPDVQRLLLDLGGRLLADEQAATRVEQMFGALAEGMLRRAAPEAARSGGAVLQQAAALLTGHGREQAADGLLRKAVEIEPGHAEIACRVARRELMEGRPEDARRVLETALNEGGRDPLALAQLSVVCERLGDTDARRRCVEELLQRPTDNVIVTRIAVAYLLDTDQLTRALQVIDAVLASQPEHAGLWLDRGRVLLLQEEPEAAREALQRGLDHASDANTRRDLERHLALVASDNALATAHRVDRALRDGDAEGALQLARALVRRSPQLADGWLLIGIARQRLDQPRRAERALRKALYIDPDMGEVRNRLGILLVARRRYAEGFEHLRRAVGLLPNEASVWLHYAQACHFVGREDEGRDALARAVQCGAEHGAVAAVRDAFFPGS